MKNTFLESVETASDSDTDDSRPHMNHTKTAPAGYVVVVGTAESLLHVNSKTSADYSFCIEDGQGTDGQLAMNRPWPASAPFRTLVAPRWATEERIKILRNLGEQCSMTTVRYQEAGQHDQGGEMLLTSEPEVEPELEQSVGAASHGTNCIPCAWFWKPRGCFRQKACGYCHLCPKGELKRRKAAKNAGMRKGAARELIQGPSVEENALL